MSEPDTAERVHMEKGNKPRWQRGQQQAAARIQIRANTNPPEPPSSASPSCSLPRAPQAPRLGAAQRPGGSGRRRARREAPACLGPQLRAKDPGRTCHVSAGDFAVLLGQRTWQIRAIRESGWRSIAVTCINVP
eukprot:3524732-Rhodomonas_salina.2